MVAQFKRQRPSKKKFVFILVCEILLSDRYMQHLFVFKCLVSTCTEHLLNKVLLSGKFYLFVSEVYLRKINSES